jgi:predicted metal-dependent enzyme (double-stranded beta helix superfamily)
MVRGSFDVERFIEACRAVVAAGEGQAAVRELIAEAVANPADVASAMGDPEHAGLGTLYRGHDLTILNATWAPWMCLKPHNHSMWSVVGVFSGREDNIFWRRADRTIEAAGARSLASREVTTLGRDVIHSVTNPIGKMTRAIHVYGGDFFAPAEPRSEWDPETLVEQPWNMENTRRLFAEAELRARGSAPR